MTNYLNEAFQKLSLVEDDFNFSAHDTGVADELKSFVTDDIDIVDEEPIIDVEADSTDELQDTYVGKVILECDTCHARIYKDKKDVVVDEEKGLANIEEECPVCGEKGWNVVGKIEEFEPKHEDEEEEAEDEVEETEEKPEKKAKKKDEEDEEEVEESLKEAFEEAYGDCEDCGDDIRVEENAIMDRVRAKMELGESEEKFPDPSKHDYVKTVEGTKMYYCNDCGKYAAKIEGIDGKKEKVKADSEEELEKKIKKASGALKEGINMDKLRRKLEMEDSLEEAFDPTRLRAKMEMGESCDEGLEDDINAIMPTGKGPRIKTKVFRDSEESRKEKRDYNDPDFFMNKNRHLPVEYGEDDVDPDATDVYHFAKLSGYSDDESVDEGINASKLRRKLEMEESCEDCEKELPHFDSKKIRAAIMGDREDCEEAFDPERVRAKMLGESLLTEGELTDTAYVFYEKGGLNDVESWEKHNRVSGDPGKLWFAEYAITPAEVSKRSGMPKNKIGVMSFKEYRDRAVKVVKNESGGDYNAKQAAQWFNDRFVSKVNPDHCYLNKKKYGTESDNYNSNGDSYDTQYDDNGHRGYDPNKLESLEEALHVEADGEDKVTVDKADDGSMDIHVGPGGESDFPADGIPMEDTEGLEAGDEMIAPLSDEDEEEIKANTGDEEEEEEPAEEESDENVEDFDEESFDNMGESYVRRVYEDVESYKTTNVAVNESQLVVEGLITMRSGATKPTKFIFGNATYTKSGKLVLEGMNKTFSNKKNAFVLKGTLTNGKFIGESMLYKYPAKALNESKQMETYLCSGRVIAKKK